MTANSASKQNAEWDHTPPQLSVVFATQSPPKPPGLAMASSTDRKPTLTETFNHASDPRVRIALLRAKLSRPVPTLEYGVKGSVVRSINPKRDRAILKQIEALSKVLSQSRQKALAQKFDLQTSNQITPTFNVKASRR